MRERKKENEGEEGEWKEEMRGGLNEGMEVRNKGLSLEKSLEKRERLRNIE